jgi:hypothetical protein
MPWARQLLGTGQQVLCPLVTDGPSETSVPDQRGNGRDLASHTALGRELLLRLLEFTLGHGLTGEFPGQRAVEHRAPVGRPLALERFEHSQHPGAPGRIPAHRQAQIGGSGTGLFLQLLQALLDGGDCGNGSHRPEADEEADKRCGLF